MPFISPDITKSKNSNQKLKYSDDQIGHLKHPDWHHEVLGQIKGQNVVKISNPNYVTKHFHVVDPKTNDVHMQIYGHSTPNNPDTFHIGWLEGRASPVKAHDVYDFLLRKGHVKQFETSEQSPGGVHVWQKLSKRRNINVYGLDHKNTPTNVDLSDTHDYGDHGLELRYEADAEAIPPHKPKYEDRLKELDKHYDEVHHERHKRFISLYASYHPHVLREHIIKLRQEREFLK